MPEICEAGRFPAHRPADARTAARGRWVLWQLDNTDLLVKLSPGKASQRGAICLLERKGSWNSRQPMLWLRIKPTARSSVFTTFTCATPYVQLAAWLCHVRLLLQRHARFQDAAWDFCTTVCTTKGSLEKLSAYVSLLTAGKVMVCVKLSQSWMNAKSCSSRLKRIIWLERCDNEYTEYHREPVRNIFVRWNTPIHLFPQ